MLGAPRIAVASGVLALMVLATTACGNFSGGRHTDAVTVTVTAEPSRAAVAAPTVIPLPAVDWRIVDHAGNRYKVVTLPLDQWDVRVDWDTQTPGTSLSDVVADPRVAVATNAGIFTPEFVPGGLLASDGVELHALNLNDGGGNFHLKPNGVFEIRSDGRAAVVDSTAYDPTGVEFATQSGPALVLGGVVHPEFRAGSTNLAFRSGVGVSPDGKTVYLAMSSSLTNFYDFATLFTETLGCADALYLDGDISRLWVAGDGEPTLAGPYAGIISARPRTVT